MVKLKRQKVRSRKKDKKMSFPKRPRLSFKAVSSFLIAVVVLGAIGMGLVRLKYMFVDSGHFMIKGVDIKLYDESGTLRRLSINDIGGEEILGANIFFMDIKALKENIELAHPEFKDIVIRRLLPNKLIVQGNLRKAIAQIRSDRYYLVDEEGVLLPDVKNFPDPALPIITGIGVNLAKVSMSTFSKFEREKLDKALSLIIEVSAKEALSKQRLKVVDITDPGNLSFSFESANVEIKIGNSDFPDRLAVLSTLLEQLGEDVGKFKYIDLRFEDPILGPR